MKYNNHYVRELITVSTPFHLIFNFRIFQKKIIIDIRLFTEHFVVSVLGSVAIRRQVCTRASTHTHTHTHTHTGAYAHTHTHVRERTLTHTRAHTNTHTDTRSIARSQKETERSRNILKIHIQVILIHFRVNW